MYAGKKIRVIFHERIPETVPIANLLSRQELPVNIPTLFKDQDPRRISVDSVLLLLYLRLNRRQGYGRTGVFKSAGGERQEWDIRGYQSHAYELAVIRIYISDITALS